jgi:hypothetical protein
VRRSNFALRLQPALLDEARKLAASEGVALNQLINVAVAEKVSVLRTEEYFAERARRADPEKIARILRRVGKGNPPVEGDEFPAEFQARSKKRSDRRESGAELQAGPNRLREAALSIEPGKRLGAEWQQHMRPAATGRRHPRFRVARA